MDILENNKNINNILDEITQEICINHKEEKDIFNINIELISSTDNKDNKDDNKDNNKYYKHINIVMKNIYNKKKYIKKLIQKDVDDMMNNIMPMTIEEFYNFIKNLVKKFEMISFEYKDVNNTQIEISWSFGIFNISRKISFIIYEEPQTENQRVDLMSKDLMKCHEEIKQLKKATDTMTDLKKEIELLKSTNKTNDLKNSLKINEIEKYSVQNNVMVGVTIWSHNQRIVFTSLNNSLFEIPIVKKYDDTILHVHMLLSVHGENNPETVQIWTCTDENDRKIIVCGQSEGYVNNSGYHREIKSMITIAGHNAGKLKLSMKFDDGMIPFTVLNPNKTDHGNFKDRQSSSMIRIDEIKATVIDNNKIPNYLENYRKSIPKKTT